MSSILLREVSRTKIHLLYHTYHHNTVHQINTNERNVAICHRDDDSLHNTRRRLREENCFRDGPSSRWWLSHGHAATLRNACTCWWPLTRVWWIREPILNRFFWRGLMGFLYADCPRRKIDHDLCLVTVSWPVFHPFFFAFRKDRSLLRTVFEVGQWSMG